MRLAVPDNTTTPPLKIGELLVQQGAITAEQLAHALDVQAAIGRPLGDLCERLFDLDPQAADTAWAEQFATSQLPRDISDEVVDSRCVGMLRPRQAWQFRLMPLRFEALPADHVTPRHLVLATTSDGLRRAMNFAARSFTVPPSLIVATPASLRAVLAVYYPVSSDLADRAFAR